MVLNADAEVGIVDVEIYYPNFYVEQADLEVADRGESDGRYTIGLGQAQMAVCPENEESVSMALTVLQRVVKRCGISYSDIGRLDVGTESSVDLSKSIKSYLMQLFPDDVYGIEGADNINACYGGTAALFNVFNWLQSCAQAGQLGVVVTTDLAVYEKDNTSAHATAGAAAICLVLSKGPSILSFERGATCHYMSHVFDFCKPLYHHLPMVDGLLSQWSFIKSLLMNAFDYFTKQRKTSPAFNFLDRENLFAFHCPYTKLVSKSFTYMAYFMRRISSGQNPKEMLKYLENLLTSSDKDTRRQRQLFEKEQFELIAEFYENNVEPSLEFSRRIGNCYCSALYLCLASTIAKFSPDQLRNRRIILFSYGSGSLSSLFSLRVTDEMDGLKKLQSHLLKRMRELDQRTRLTADTVYTLLKYRTSLPTSWEPTHQLLTSSPGDHYVLDLSKGLETRNYVYLEHDLKA